MTLVTERTLGGVDVDGARVASGRGGGWCVEDGLRPGNEGAPLPIGE